MQILGSTDMDKIVRLQLARMRPGVEIYPHVDRGMWALNSHRIHVPVTAASGVTFDVRIPFVFWAVLCEVPVYLSI